MDLSASSSPSSPSMPGALEDASPRSGFQRYIKWGVSKHVVHMPCQTVDIARLCSAWVTAKQPFIYLAWQVQTVKGRMGQQRKEITHTEYKWLCGLCVEQTLFVGACVWKIFSTDTIPFTFDHDVHEKARQLQCLKKKPRPNGGAASLGILSTTSAKNT